MKVKVCLRCNDQVLVERMMFPVRSMEKQLPLSRSTWPRSGIIAVNWDLNWRSSDWLYQNLDTNINL